MPKLIDDIRRKNARIKMPFIVAEEMELYWARQMRAVVDLLRDPQLPVLVIDNVAEYFYAGTDQEFWDLKRDFPNLAPPFPQFWCEYRMAKKISSKLCGDTDFTQIMPLGGRVGQLITTLDPKEITAVQVPENTKWGLWAEIFIDFSEDEITCTGPHGSMLILVDAEGRITGHPQIQNLGGKDVEPVAQSLLSWLHPALLTISFLHCKNVQVVENPVPPKLQKRYRERHPGDQLAPHKTLVIEPLKQILRTQGGSGQVGLAKAMHICRGHFRDYREGKGLFGKYHQLVWTPAIVRGTKGKEAPPREIEVKI
jgi:hypothetical protein